MAAPPTRPALRAKYDAKRRALVAGAARVFAQRGYDQTSVQDLADALGIAAGGLYHYFGSKEQLLIGICDELMEPLLADAEALLADPIRSPAERLGELIALWVAHVAVHRDHMLVFQQERHVIEHGAQWRSVRASRKAFEREVERVLAEVEDAGQAGWTDRRVALSALLGMINHTAQWFRPKGRLTPDEIARGYCALVLRA